MSATATHRLDPPDGEGPSLATTIQLAASGGRADRVRISLTMIGSAAATAMLLTAASVAFITTNDGPYRLNLLSEPGLRPGVMIAILLLTVPLVLFVGLCSRVGAPARDRRLSMFRMAGATPGEATRIAAIETGLAALVGAIVGVGTFFVGRTFLDGTKLSDYRIVYADGSTGGDRGQTRLLPTDVNVPVWAVIAIVAVIAIGTTAASIVTLRKVRISPFGVTRTVPSEPPTRTAAALFLGSTTGLLVVGTSASRFAGQFLPFVLVSFVLFVCSVVGLVMGSASVASAAGRFLAPRVSRPDLLIASRRMIAAPFTSSRGTASVLLVALIGGALQGTRISFLAYTDPGDTFYADTFSLIDGVLVIAIALAAASLLVTSAEAIVERRRTLAVLAAGGTPRAVLARAAIAEVLVPLVPAVLLASAAGLLASRAFFGTTVSGSDEATNSQTSIPIAIPWERLIVLDAGIVAASIAITSVSLVFLARSTRPSELRAAV